jgi:hypothetical protein
MESTYQIQTSIKLIGYDVLRCEVCDQPVVVYWEEPLIDGEQPCCEECGGRLERY